MRTSARGLIAVDKMGGKVLFLDPVSNETTLILDDFEQGNVRSAKISDIRNERQACAAPARI